MRPFWQEAGLQSIGPLTGAIVGTLIIGFLAQGIAHRGQAAREVQRMREKFIRDATDVAVSLFAATERYWRARVDEELKDDALGMARYHLDEQFQRSRVAGEVLEARLFAAFGDDSPRYYMHQTMVLLRVRYYQVLANLTPDVLSSSAGVAESGLNASEMESPETVIGAYQLALLKVLDELVAAPIRLTSRAKGTTGAPGNNTGPRARRLSEKVDASEKDQ